MSSEHYTPAVNPLPPVVVALVLFIIGIELAFTLGARGSGRRARCAVGWRLGCAAELRLFGRYLRLDGAERSLAVRACHPFRDLSLCLGQFHPSGFCLRLRAGHGQDGRPRSLAAFRCCVIFVLSGVGGALAYALILDPSYPLVGGFPPVYGLIGAFTWLLWRKLSLVGENQARAFQLIAC